MEWMHYNVVWWNVFWLSDKSRFQCSNYMEARVCRAPHLFFCNSITESSPVNGDCFSSAACDKRRTSTTVVFVIFTPIAGRNSDVAQRQRATESTHRAQKHQPVDCWSVSSAPPSAAASRWCSIRIRPTHYARRTSAKHWFVRLIREIEYGMGQKSEWQSVDSVLK